MSNRYQTPLKEEDFVVMIQNECRSRRFCLWYAPNSFECSPLYQFCLRCVSPQKKQDFAKLFAVVSIRSVRNRCVKILSQGINYCYVDKLPKSIILCEQWNTLFIKRLNLTWLYFYKKPGSPVLNVIVGKKFRMKGLKPYVPFANCTESAGCFEAYKQPPPTKFRSHILSSCGG